MVGKLFIHTISVIRFYQVGEDAFGEASTASTTPFGINARNQNNEIVCRVEEWKGEMQYRDSNERGINKTIVYVPPQYKFKLDDYIYWGTNCSPLVETGDFLGRVIGINPALKGNTTNVDHYEVIIENP